MRATVVGMTVRVFIPWRRVISAANYGLTLFILPWLQRQWQFTLGVEISCGEGKRVHCAGQELLQLYLEKTCLAAWPSSQWVAGLGEHVTSCQEMIMFWVSVLVLLKEGKLLFGKHRTLLSSPDLQSNQFVQEIAQVSKCTYLCMICREVLWLGCSLILW